MRRKSLRGGCATVALSLLIILLGFGIVVAAIFAMMPLGILIGLIVVFIGLAVDRRKKVWQCGYCSAYIARA